MCGIAGIFSSANRKVDEKSLLSMGSAMPHRGPDDTGIFIDSDAQLGLIHKRLAILDLSPLGHQPMFSASKRFVCAYNGEIYNFRQLREELKKAGFAFKSESDTEVLVNGFEHWGIIETVKKCVGMFAISVFDQKRKKLNLIRDRMGEKPLYYNVNNGELLFASEIACLEAIPWFKRDINKNALTLLFRHGFISAPHSIYENTFKLMPGHYIEFDVDNIHNKVESTPYWELRATDAHQSITFEEAVNHTETLLEDSIKGQMISDAPLGAFLSGGIDSSLIVSLMQKQSMNKVKTFSIGFNEKQFNEAEFAKDVANHLGTDHTELYVSGQDALDVIEKLPKIYSEPFADSSQIPTYLLCKMAKRDVTVALSGDAGDELFCGYQRYFDYNNRLQKQGSLKAKLKTIGLDLPIGFQKAVAKAINQNAALLNDILLTQKLKREKLLATRDVEGFYREAVSLNNFPEELILNSTQPHYALNDAVPHLYSSDIKKSQMWLDTHWYLPDDILVKVDRAAMANSLETRVPMLDHRLVEFAMNLSPLLNVKNNEGKQILREILFKHVPRNLIERPKTGFGIPKDSWLRNELKEWAGDLLSSNNLKNEGILNSTLIREMWNAHQQGKGNFGFQLWGILMFQQWKQKK